MRAQLTPQKKKAIACLLTAKDYKSAARAAGVSYSTLINWLQDKEFQAALRRAENRVIDGTARRVVNASSAALDFLQDLLSKEEAGENNKVRAALALVDLTMDMRARTDVAEARALAADPSESEWWDRGLKDAAKEARERKQVAYAKQLELAKLAEQKQDAPNGL